jgi:hypothetical protein
MLTASVLPSPWPMAMPYGKRTPEYEAVWRETGRQIREHLDSKPRWSKVVKIAFLDGLDESYNELAYDKMLVLRQAAPRCPRARLV